MTKIKNNLVTLLFFLIIALLFVGSQTHADDSSSFSTQTTQVDTESFDDEVMESEGTTPKEITIEESEDDSNALDE